MAVVRFFLDLLLESLFKLFNAKLLSLDRLLESLNALLKRRSQGGLSLAHCGLDHIFDARQSDAVFLRSKRVSVLKSNGICGCRTVHSVLFGRCCCSTVTVYAFNLSKTCMLFFKAQEIHD